MTKCDRCGSETDKPTSIVIKEWASGGEFRALFCTNCSDKLILEIKLSKASKH